MLLFLSGCLKTVIAFTGFRSLSQGVRPISQDPSPGCCEKGTLQMVGKTDEELIAMFQTGDAAAFEALFAKYKAPIYVFLVRQCGNREVAADLTQDVFTKLLNRADTFRHQSKFSTWIYTIARNTAMDHARKSKHRNHTSLDAAVGDVGLRQL